MKSAVIVLACVFACAYGQYNKASAFASFNQNPSRNYNRFQRPVVPAPVVAQFPPAVPQRSAAVATAKVSASDSDAQVLKSDTDINPDGTYNYYYETNNGIAAQEQGSPRNLGGNPPAVANVAQGSFSWTSPEGRVISISYVADENGYQPQGDAIPQAPPVPPQIARALEYLARNAQ